ncbi:MAG: ComEC/Rec2 family competence protein [Muribaculaceae bacterium]|nr:ComEC/Rec2 family competence protein [Muribaculaceae bacterium]
MPTVLSKIPVLRILVPFMLGIMTHRLWHCWWLPAALIILAVVGYRWLDHKNKTPTQRLQWRAYFTIPIIISAFALGWLCALIHSPARLTPQQRTDRILIGRVVELGYTDFSMRLTVYILDKELPKCTVLLSTRGCDYTMQPGDLVAWHAGLNETTNMGNPDEMSYADYLINSKNIRYQQHLPLNQIRKVGNSPTLMTRMANIRRQWERRVYESRLSPDTQHFVIALLIGNSRLIDQTTREVFASAGVAHVLALSGLHVGLIALIIWGLLFPLDYLKMKKLRLVIALIAIVLFALFTGMSPSVMRAAIMTGFVVASLIFSRRSVSLNALAMAALLILVFSPQSLFTVGFQLSFITVAAVLLFAKVPHSLKSRFKAVNYLTSTAITSVVAMLATVALSAHYFHTISLLSVLSNLLILPVLPLIMIFGSLFLLVTAAGMQIPALDWMLDTLYRYIHGVSGWVNALGWSHMSGVYMSSFGVIAYFLVLTFIILWLYRRNHRYLLAAGLTVVVALGHSMWIDARTPKQGLVILNSFSSTPIVYYDSGNGYVWIPDDVDPDTAAFSRFYAGFLAHHRIDSLHYITGYDSLRLEGGFIKPPYAHLMGQRLMAVGSGRWKRLTTTSPLSIDDIIVTKHYHGTAAKLSELFNFKRLIISGGHYEKARLKHECDSLGIHVIDGPISY